MRKCPFDYAPFDPFDRLRAGRLRVYDRDYV